MKKWIFVLMVIAMLILTGMDCFAQSDDERVRAFQGEWLVIRVQAEDGVIDFSEPPFNEIELVWRFEGNNFILEMKDHETKDNFVETGTFAIIGSSLVIYVQEEKATLSYTLQGNILTITTEGIIFTIRKQ